jgi:hypothetical protein
MEIRPYVPDDFLAIDLQPMQKILSFGGQTEDCARGLHQSQEAYTVTIDGEVMACIGLVEFWPGRRMAWAYLSGRIGRQMVELTWKIRRWLRYHGEGRIEAYIDPKHAAAERWAMLLGFQREGALSEWIPGKDYDMYARIGR